MTVASVPIQVDRSPPPREILQDARYKVFQPFGAALEVFYCKDPEILSCGPAGTGKSRGILEKMHFCAMKYPGMRGLIVRKTRESITQSAMVTFEEFVLPDDGSVKFRTAQQEYRYNNRSKIVIGGMDKASKVLSSEYDFIYAQEATELTEEDWETLTTRCRFGKMPYNQVVGDCNPDSSRHWLLKRRNDNKLRYFRSIHEDNPVLFNHKTGEWTERGEAYMDRLSNLTGVRRKRLFEGIWASAEGAIYEEYWKPEVHLINRMAIPFHWPRVWVVDFGFRDPMVIQVWALDEENDLAYRFAELYQTNLLVEDAAAIMKHWMRREHEPRPRAIVCDHDAEGRATLERHLGMDTMPADKGILAGIDIVQAKLRDDKLLFLRDSSIEVDVELRDSGRPWRTEDEFDSYEWNDKVIREKPKDGDDHGLDCTRYFSTYWGGDDSWVMGMGS